MKIECIISDLSFPLEERCSKCLECLDGDYTTSQKAYAICYLTYRHILDNHFIDKDFLTKKLDEAFGDNYINKSEETRWRTSILIARIYLHKNVTDIWWWNYGTKEKLNVNNFAIINFLRLINLSVAFNITNDIFIDTAYKYAVELYRHFYQVVSFDNIDLYGEINLAQNQIKILSSLRQYISTAPGNRKSFEEIVKMETKEPFHSMLKRTLKL